MAERNDYPNVNRTNKLGIEHAFSWAVTHCICSLVCGTSVISD